MPAPGPLLYQEGQPLAIYDGWSNHDGSLTFQATSDAITLEVVGEHRWDSSLERLVTGLDPAVEYSFLAQVETSRSGLVYLQVKRYKDGKEISRKSSKRNWRLKEAIQVDFTPGEADRIQLLIRTPTSKDYFGATAKITAMTVRKFTPPQPEELPRFVIVPGYQVASLYLNHLQAETPEEFSSTVQYRVQGSELWLDALPMVYIWKEQRAAASILKLQENTAYDVRVAFTDKGKEDKVEGRFQTLTPAVPIARTIELGPDNYPGSLDINDEGSPDGYIRYVAKPGFVLHGDMASTNAITITGARYVILEGLTILGAKVNGISILGSDWIQIRNCDIAGFARVGVQRPDINGTYYENDRRLNNDAGIRMMGSNNVLLEGNYIHDPRGTANSWFHSHPAGPNAVYVGECAAVAIRYNDFVGCDAHRWNDVIEGSGNGSRTGSMYQDAEVCGNYLAFGDDDGIELDGGQSNARFFYNKSEGLLCGVSTAPCLIGPSYLYQNLICDLGDVYGFAGASVKNVFRDPGKGTIFFFNNTIAGPGGGFSSYSGGSEAKDMLNGPLKGFARNNVIAATGGPMSSALFTLFRSDFDYSLFGRPGNNETTAMRLREQYGQEKNSVAAPAQFVAEEGADYRLQENSPGWQAGCTVPNVMPQATPNMGAYQPGSIEVLPYRPLSLQTDTQRLQFTWSPEGIAPQRVVLSLREPGEAVPFTIRKNDSLDFLQVEPATGLVVYGQPLTLNVSIDVAKIPHAKQNSGSFLVRTANGLSRPVSVYVDASAHRALADRDRAQGVIRAEVKAQDDDSYVLRFNVPQDGSYYLFAYFATRPSSSIKESYNGQSERAQLYCSHGGGALWGFIGRNSYSGQANRPRKLAAGIHEFVIGAWSRNGTLPPISAAALTEDHNAFALSPFVE
ncbi:MAG: right-handed parallel beta-helix repeat-containing protein [Lentisphaeria bacterium]|nr:right-handed parallel beta-helix repeat-containing protein [Lentisphaeria bacterium]